MFKAFSEFNKWDEGAIWTLGQEGPTCEIAAAGTPCVVGSTQEDGLCEASGSCQACEEGDGCGVKYAGDETTATTTTTTTTITSTTATATSITMTTTTVTTTTVATTTTAAAMTSATRKQRASTTTSSEAIALTATKISSQTTTAPSTKKPFMPKENGDLGLPLSTQQAPSPLPPPPVPSSNANQSSAANNSLADGNGSNNSLYQRMADGSSTEKSKLGGGIVFLIVLIVLAACSALLYYYLARNESVFLTRICSSCTWQNESANTKSANFDGDSGGNVGTIDMMLNPMHTPAKPSNVM